jgi:hypothetical protein
MFESMFHYGTHCDMTGSPNSGKSTLAELCVREKIKGIHATIHFDFHGTTFARLVDYCAYLQPPQPVYILNFSQPKQTGVLPFDLMTPSAGAMLSTHVSRLAESLLKPWGVANANLMPTYERVIKPILAYCALTGEPLHHGAHLLQFENRELRAKAIELMSDPRLKSQLHRLQHISALPHGYREWMHEVESSDNRLNRIASSEIVKLFTGLPAKFSVARAWEEDAVVLVNLTPNRKYLSHEEARTIAALLLDEYLQCALDRANDPKPLFAYLDECQNYLSPDIGPILEGCRKSGFRATLIHQHMGQFNDRPALQEAIRTTARCRFIFGGLPAARRREETEECFLPELAARTKKDDRLVVRTEYENEAYEVSNYSFNDSYSTSRDPETDNVTDTLSYGSGRGVVQGDRYVPRQYLEAIGQEDFTAEDKRLTLSRRFADLEPTEAYLNLPDGTRFYKSPWCESYLANDKDFVRFMSTTLRNNIPLHAAQQQIKEREETFLARVQPTQLQDEPRRIGEKSGRKPKSEARPPRLHPQS